MSELILEANIDVKKKNRDTDLLLFHYPLSAFLKDQAEFRTGQVAGMLRKLKNHRLTPGSIGAVLGALQGSRNMADNVVYSQFGDNGVRMTRAGEQYNELSKMALRQGIDDIAEHGQIGKDTRGALTKLKNIREAATQLRSQEANTSFGISPGTAHQFGHYLRSHDVAVKDAELANATANASWTVDGNGNLVPSMRVTNKGKKLGEVDWRTSEVGKRGISYDTAKTIGWCGSFAGYDFISAERTDPGGGMTKKSPPRTQDNEIHAEK